MRTTRVGFSAAGRVAANADERGRCLSLGNRKNEDGRCRGLATVGLIGSALWACLGFLTRARASTETLQPVGFDPARQQRRLAKVSESRPCADPGLSPTSQLAVTAERSVKDPNGRALSPQMSSTTDHSASNRNPRGSLSGRLESCRMPGILRHGFSVGRFGASACMTPLARNFTGTPRGRTPNRLRGRQIAVTSPSRRRFRYPMVRHPITHNGGTSHS